MIFISLILCVMIFAIYRTPNNVLLDPFTVFSVSVLYYGYLIPVCMLLFSDYFLPFQGSGLIVASSELNIIAVLLFLCYAGFVFGYRLILAQGWIDCLVTERDRLSEAENKGAQKFLGRLSLGLLAFFLLFFSGTLLEVLSGYENKIEARYDASAYNLVYQFLLLTVVSYSVVRVLQDRNYKAYTILTAAILLVLSFLTFSKDPMVYCAIFLLAAGARFFKANQGVILIVAVGFAILTLVFLVPMFSIYRATGALTFSDPSGVPLAFLFSDASGPFSSIVLAIRDQGLSGVAPLYESFALWIPRFVWAERPLDAAEAYAQAVMFDWRPGFGLGYSPFAEAESRFGLAFAPLLFFISGLFIAGTQRFLRRVIPAGILIGVMFVVQSYALFVSLRGPFSGQVTSMAQFWIPFLALLWFVGSTRKSGESSHKNAGRLEV
jgi:hypothetical protein